MRDNEGKMVRYQRKPLTDEQTARLEAVADLPDDQIDFSDIPEADDVFFANAVRGRFHRPIKQQLTLRLDADVVDWFKRRSQNGKGYQTDINRVLLDYVTAQRTDARKKAG